jgi:cephalosporin hydroxylase
MINPMMSELELTREHIDPRFKVTVGGVEKELDAYSEEGFRALTDLWTRSGWQRKISYELTWLGIPIIQLPEDIAMMQEILWKVRPDVVVECGVAHGGALVLYASILELLGKGHVVGVDVEIRKYNRLAIESHPLSHRITLIEGDSTSAEVVSAVQARIKPRDTVLVALDSLHTRAHVAAELERYAPLVTPNSYVVVFDGVMTMLTDAPSGSPSWRDDNPLEAVRDFLRDHEEFEIDQSYNRLGATHCPQGFLRRRSTE